MQLKIDLQSTSHVKFELDVPRHASSATSFWAPAVHQLSKNIPEMMFWRSESLTSEVVCADAVATKAKARNTHALFMARFSYLRKSDCSEAKHRLFAPSVSLCSRPNDLVCDDSRQVWQELENSLILYHATANIEPEQHDSTTIVAYTSSIENIDGITGSIEARADCETSVLVFQSLVKQLIAHQDKHHFTFIPALYSWLLAGICKPAGKVIDRSSFEVSNGRWGGSDGSNIRARGRGSHLGQCSAFHAQQEVSIWSSWVLPVAVCASASKQNVSSWLAACIATFGQADWAKQSLSLPKDRDGLGPCMFALRFRINCSMGFTRYKIHYVCSPHVEFCGYSIPHPSDNLVNLRIQTTGQLPFLAISLDHIFIRQLISLDLHGARSLHMWQTRLFCAAMWTFSP